MTDPAEWRAFLAAWHAAMLACDDLTAALPPETRVPGWAGYPGAPEAVLTAAEARLGAHLPPSYRAFLRATDGWPQAGFFIARLLPAAEIAWYAAAHQDLIDAWIGGTHYAGPPAPIPDAEYFVYGAAQDPMAMREEYLQTALQVSEDLGGDGVVLLNPRIVTPEGEWEAWFHAAWIPGARRYRTFADLMRAEYESFLDTRARLYVRTPAGYRRKR